MIARALGEGSKIGKSPKVVRKGCKRSVEPRERKASCTGATWKQGCTWCKRLLGDLCAVGPKDLVHPLLTTFGDSPILDPSPRHSGSQVWTNDWSWWISPEIRMDQWRSKFSERFRLDRHWSIECSSLSKNRHLFCAFFWRKNDPEGPQIEDLFRRKNDPEGPQIEELQFRSIPWKQSLGGPISRDIAIPKDPNLEFFHSRLSAWNSQALRMKISFSLENFIPAWKFQSRPREFPTAVWLAWNFILDWRFHSRLKLSIPDENLEIFQSLGPLGYYRCDTPYRAILLSGRLTAPQNGAILPPWYLV